MANTVLWTEGVPQATRRIQVSSSVNHNPFVNFNTNAAREGPTQRAGSSTPHQSSNVRHQMHSKTTPSVKTQSIIKTMREFFRKIGICSSPRTVMDADLALAMMDIEAGGEAPEQPNRENPLRNFLQWMYNMGMSAFNPNVDGKVQRSRLTFLISILLKVIFWTGVCFGIMQSLLDAKFFGLYFLADGGIMKFVSFGFHVITILVQIAMIRVFGFLHEKFLSLLRKLDELNEFDEDQRNQHPRGRENWILVTLLITTIVKCLLQSGLDKAFGNLPIVEKIEQIPYKFVYDMKVWNVEEMNNGNITAQLSQDISESTLTMKMTTALAYIIIRFSKEMKLEIAVDLIIVACICLLKYIRRLIKRIKNSDNTSDTTGNDLAALESPSGDWAYYLRLAATNKALNSVLEGLLKLMHAYNVMKFAYFLMKIPDKKTSWRQFLYLLYSCTKVSIAYYLAKQANGYNADLQHWIINWAMRSKDLEFIQKAKFALEKLKLDILGLGTGEFVLGESFLLKFGGMAVSVFMLEVDKGDGY